MCNRLEAVLSSGAGFSGSAVLTLAPTEGSGRKSRVSPEMFAAALTLNEPQKTAR